MNTLSYKTVSANSKTVTKEWVVIDANAEILGRLSSKIAFILRGKHKANFTPHVDCGDNVIVINADTIIDHGYDKINADKVRFTGNKFEEKEYVSYTGYPGGQKFISPKDLMAKHPTRVVEKAIRGMLPKNKLGNKVFKNLHVYAGAEHPHAAQTPKTIKL